MIASLTIPISILIALVLMDIFGIALTVMSIGGLAIGIGKMANGSIIMVENIFRVLNEKKGQASTFDLTLEASKDVGTYLFSANLIIILVFLPLLTLQGIEGAMFRPTAFAVVAALFGALVVNLTLQPVLASYVLDEKHVKERRNPVTEWVNEKYRAVLTAALERKTLVLVVVTLILVGTVVAFSFLGNEFVPPLDEGAIMASSVMLPETSLEESIKVGRQIEEIFLSFPEVVSVSRTTGTAEASEHLHPVNHSHYNIELVPKFIALAREVDTKAMKQYVLGPPYSTHPPNSTTGGVYTLKLDLGKMSDLSVKLFGSDSRYASD